jgi:hypothetical protein
VPEVEGNSERAEAACERFNHTRRQLLTSATDGTHAFAEKVVFLSQDLRRTVPFLLIRIRRQGTCGSLHGLGFFIETSQPIFC